MTTAPNRNQTGDGDETERLRLDLRYDGSGFHGWAKQPGLRTVQGELEASLETIFRSPVSMVVAGRTDAGVHATAQVAHVDVPKGNLLEEGTGNQKAFRARLNGLLASGYSRWRAPGAERLDLPRGRTVKGESDLVVYRATRVDDAFDARFSALRRRYVYRLVDNAVAKNPVARTSQWWVPDCALDLEAMKAGADHLLGEHDFLSFCKPREGATTIRELQVVDVSRSAAGVVEVSVVGDAFCHNMVRAIVGALVDVGRGRKDPGWVAHLVANATRDHGVQVAPAKGLTLVGVDYPDRQDWAARATAARNVRKP